MKELKIKKLNINDLDSMVVLQKKINDNLAEDEKHFILPKSRQEFYKALKNDNYFIAGVFDGEKLVAQSTLGLPKDNEKRDLSEFAGDYSNSEIAIYKTIIVDPEYRKHGLMKHMLEYFETLDEVKERKLAIIQIAADNPASWINAMKHGMEITKVSEDPDDSAQVLYLQKSIDGTPVKNIDYNNGYKLSLGSDIHKNAPVLFNKMCKLSETMVGGKWDKESKSIVWYEKQEENIMPVKDKFLIFVKGAASAVHS
ncbi:MAG: GNAT family N-acetyltransferase [Lactobacillaceae bacterium]|jgi:GNAT superfamily N-acetyltransferase|nr:GNAT family N-acetyltransferase [Lactobacillaceae bacterium]